MCVCVCVCVCVCAHTCVCMCEREISEKFNVSTNQTEQASCLSCTIALACIENILNTSNTFKCILFNYMLDYCYNAYSVKQEIKVVFFMVNNQIQKAVMLYLINGVGQILYPS